MSAARAWWKPAVWLVYVVIVFEILFMISPFALYYYSAYAPFLNFLRRSPATAWLDQFFLPHFSQTSSAALNFLGDWDETIFFAGVILFALGFVQVYAAKFLRRGQPVTGGLYRWIRHPQYLTFSLIGLGVLLHWPRFLVLVGYVTMLFLYYFLARHEERRCLARYGGSYQAYLERTGMFFPRGWPPRWRGWFAWLPRFLPERGTARIFALVALYVVFVGAAVYLGFCLQSYSLDHISSYATADLAVLSPAQLPSQRLAEAVELAASPPEVAETLAAQGYGRGEKFLAYVVPIDWRLPDLPMEQQRTGGHHTPRDFDPNQLKVLFTRIRLFGHHAQGLDIVRRAVRRESILLVKVDLAQRSVVGWEQPPATVRWGDVPTPYF